MKTKKLQTIIFALAAMLGSACYSSADSQVRIVRLSEVQGGVEINRTDRGYEKAFLNLPITQGNEVRTRSDGRAQIEFEDGSALRLAPSTTVRFSQLFLGDSGNKVSAVSIGTGTAYVDFKAGKTDQLTVNFGRETVILNRPTHLRIELQEDNVAVAVLNGAADVRTASGTVALSKNRTAIFDASGDLNGKVAKNIEPNPYDAWDKEQDRFQQRFGSETPVTASAYSYGLTDLNYYGSYFNAPGYGLMWQPYLVGSNWDPFMEGAWAFYPGAGFAWVSAYPWGWTPYHSGSWAFVPGRGWAWQPGGSWTALSSPRVVNPPANFVMPRRPSAAAQNLVVVNRGPATTFAGRSTSKVVLQNNSAGLGVPRGEVNDLAKISQHAAAQGTVTARIHAAPVQANSGPSSSGQSSSFPGNSQRQGVWQSQSQPGRSTARPTPSAGPSVHSAPGRGPNRN